MAVTSVKGKSDSTGTALPSASPAKPARRRPSLMSIRVHYDVGLGNRITVRGDTKPFRWDRGVDAQNMAADVWEFRVEPVPAGRAFQFKPLINDTTYSTGDNYVSAGRKTLDIYPVF